MPRLIHTHLDIRGILANWSDRQLNGLLLINGKRATSNQVRSALLDELEKGHKVLPIGPACEGFDYSGVGCPGHEVENG